MKALVFVVIFLISISFVCATEGIGISPGCYYADAKGKCYAENITAGEYLEYKFRVYNFDNSTNKFIISVEGNLTNNTVFSPKEFVLEHHEGKDCWSSKGCKEFTVNINTTGLKPGDYNEYIVAQTSSVSGAFLNINQIVKAKVMINIVGEDREFNKKIIFYIGVPVMIILLILILRKINKRKKSKEKNGE